LKVDKTSYAYQIMVAVATELYAFIAISVVYSIN